MHILKSLANEVNAIQRPSGDQSGSVGVGALKVASRRGAPPSADMM
jgi:hypothetical protein